MIRRWLHVLSQKLVGTRVYPRQSRPAWRPRLYPRLETLETRTMMSTVGAELPHGMPTSPNESTTPPLRAPADPASGNQQWNGPADRDDPGWDELYEDVVAGSKQVQSSPFISGVAPDGSSKGATTGLGALQERLPIENLTGRDLPSGKESLGGKILENRDVVFGQSFRPTGSHAPTILQQNVQPRDSAGKSAASDTRAFKDDGAVAESASQPGTPDTALAPAHKIDRACAVPEAEGFITPPTQGAAPERASVHSGFMQVLRDVPDGSLLKRYAVRRDQVAFAALVQRHERLVFGVCLRVLGDLHAAQDALQATFLALARKACMLDKDGPLAGWLCRVAYHLALRLRGTAARQRGHEREAARTRVLATTGDAVTEIEKDEIRDALREELERLPEKYRAPLILHYFAGKTHEEAARTLGVPRGSMAKRIGEGLERLRERLTDRGFVL